MEGCHRKGDYGVMALSVLTTAIYDPFTSRGEAAFQGKVLSAMRFQFGGHLEKAATIVAARKREPHERIPLRRPGLLRRHG